MSPIPVHFDMESQDPDDVFTLCLLATHPRVDLKGVTIFPGGKDQVGLVKHVLERLDRPDVPVGAIGHDDGKTRVSAFHYKWLGKIDPQDPDGSAVEILLDSREADQDCCLLTGAPLSNVHEALEASEQLRRGFFRFWTCQGGFAGDNVVPEEHRLEKFKGRITCPTFNLGGDRKAAQALLGSPRIMDVRMVSKNVCHGVIFDPERAERMPKGAHAGLDLLLDGMRVYFKKNPGGKALHDTIAASLIWASQAATWEWGEPFYERGEWGFHTMEQLYGNELGWPMGIDRNQRHITTSLDVEKMYEAWS